MIRYFKHGYKSGWELNFMLWPYSLRIARYQFALWWAHEPIFNFLAKDDELTPAR